MGGDGDAVPEDCLNPVALLSSLTGESKDKGSSVPESSRRYCEEDAERDAFPDRRCERECAWGFFHLGIFFF